MKFRMRGWRRWALFLVAGLLCWFLYPVMRVGAFLLFDPSSGERAGLLTKDSIGDASGLHPVGHAGIVKLGADLNATEKLLRETLGRARVENLAVVPFGARHSMGKQALREGAIHVDTSGFDHLQMDGDLLRAQSGARWSQVIDFLAERGLSIEVMQSNNDFSVGGTLSVNAHGWQPNRPPVASTVEKFRLMLADGAIRECSRSNNESLFRHALGGYGLFGIILDAWIRPVPNKILRSTHRVLAIDEFLEAWSALGPEDVELAYARLSVAPSSFFREILLTTYASTGETAPPEASWDDGGERSAKLARAIFRASLNSGRGKEFRWLMEKQFGGEASGSFARSRLLDEPIRVFGNADPERTDMLMEYFVPCEKFSPFVVSIRQILAGNAEELLNVTIRSVSKDNDTALPYAKTDSFGFVMLFNVERTAEGATSLEGRARRLIEAALKMGGSFYLPYWSYATPQQLLRAYPEFPRVVREKNQVDPGKRFLNGFFDHYAKSTAETE